MKTRRISNKDVSFVNKKYDPGNCSRPRKGVLGPQNPKWLSRRGSKVPKTLSTFSELCFSSLFVVLCCGDILLQAGLRQNNSGSRTI